MLDNIPRQKQVLQDIYNILSQIAVDVQPPENVSINTSNNIHTIQNFGYNLNPKHYGSYEYAISLKIGVDYNIKNLTATVQTAHIGNIFLKLIREVDKNANEKLHEAKKTECKYKIQSSENFKTHPYCSILNKFCEDVSFVCDRNCQIYEDLKQYARAKEEIVELTSIINKSAERFANDYLDTFKENEKLKIQQLMQKSEVDTSFNTPIEGWGNDPCKICQYKQDYQAKEQLSVKQSHELISLRKELQENKQKNVILLQKNEELEKQLENEKQALDEIASLCKNEACSPCKELEENNHCDECHNKIILDIISKAKQRNSNV